MRRASVRLWGLLAALLVVAALVACLLLWNAPGGEWVAVERDGVELIAVVFKSGSNGTNRWTDARRMFDYGFALKGV